MSTRQVFDEELRQLQDELLLVGNLVQTALVNSVKLLNARDLDGARRLIVEDEEINKRRFKIENSALTLIATQQPMAGDMRVLASVLEIVTELERIGDYAKGIANINLMIGNGPVVKPLADLPQMAEKARDMLHEALTAFVNRDQETARAIPAKDDEVDDLYNQIYRELLTIIMANPQTIDKATYLLWAAHNLERAADRVVNICERVVFTVTGELLELN